MLLVLASAAVLFLVLVWAGQRRLIYFPRQDVPSAADVGLTGVDEVAFRTDDGIDLHGWWVAARAAQPNGVTVIVFNGNGGNRAYRAALAGSLAQTGMSVLLFDYRGYGGNAGSPTEDGLARDARAALRYVTTREGVDATRIVYFGESLGAAVAVRLATEQPPAALILRSPFTSMEAVGRYHYPYLPVRWLLRDRYASIDQIRTVRSPLLVVAAARDSVVPAAQSRELFEEANEPKQWLLIKAADHNDYEMVAGAGMVAAIVQLVGAR